MSDSETNLPVVFTFEILYAVVDLVSVVGSLLVFYGCFKAPNSINLSLKLILFLTAFDLIISLEDLLGEALIDSQRECTIYSFVRIFASYLSLFWSTSMSIIAYMILKDVRRNLSKIFRNIVLVCFSLSFLLALRPFVGLSSYTYKFYEFEEEDFTYCTISFSDKMTQGSIFVIFFFEQVIPYSIGVVFTLLAYLYAKSYLGEKPENSLEEVTNIESLKLLQYPIAQLAIYAPGMIYTIILIVSSAEDSLILPMLKNCYSLGGLIAFLIYRKQKKDRRDSLLENIRLSISMSKQEYENSLHL